MTDFRQVMQMMKSTLTIGLFTAIGAIGINQRIPRVISNLYDGEETKHKIVQFILLWILLMQGGGGMNVLFSFVVAAVFFGTMEILLKKQDKEDGAASKESLDSGEAVAAYMRRRGRRRV